MKKLSKQLCSTYVGAVYSGEVRGEVDTRSRMCYVGWAVWVHSCLLSFFISQPEDDHCQMPKHVVVLYVVYSVHISTMKLICVRQVHTLRSSLRTLLYRHTSCNGNVKWHNSFLITSLNCIKAGHPGRRGDILCY